MLSILKSGAKLNKKRDINANQANFSNIKACKNLSPALSQGEGDVNCGKVLLTINSIQFVLTPFPSVRLSQIVNCTW